MVVVHIVEDDVAVADALAVVLEDLSLQPKTYGDGETFLEIAELAETDWVIIDLGLPGMSGADVVRELTRLPKPPNVIAMSGKPRTRILHHLRELPELRVLRKPLSIDTLCQAMRKVAVTAG